MGPKNLGQKKWVNKITLGQKNVTPKTIWGSIWFSPRKNLGQNWCVQNIVETKKDVVSKNFGSKNVLDPTKLLSQSI